MTTVYLRNFIYYGKELSLLMSEGNEKKLTKTK